MLAEALCHSYTVGAAFIPNEDFKMNITKQVVFRAGQSYEIIKTHNDLNSNYVVFIDDCGDIHHIKKSTVDNWTAV